MNYRCVAWVLNADGVRRAECAEVISEAELARTFVVHQRQMHVPGYLACCEFARRMGFDRNLWDLRSGLVYKAHEEEARLATQLPVIIRVEEVP